MKKIRYIILAIFSFFILTNVYAECETIDYGVCKADTSLKLYDYADILKDEEEDLLKIIIDKYINDFKMDLIVVTIDHNPESSYMGQNPSTVYADDFYDYNHFNTNGSILLIDMDKRIFVITTSGSAIDVHPNRYLEMIYNRMDNYMAAKNYYGAIRDALNNMYDDANSFFSQKETKEEEVNSLELDLNNRIFDLGKQYSTSEINELTEYIKNKEKKTNKPFFIITMPKYTNYDRIYEFVLNVNDKYFENSNYENYAILVLGTYDHYLFDTAGATLGVERIQNKTQSGKIDTVEETLDKYYSYQRFPILNSIWYGLEDTFIFSILIAFIVVIILVNVVDKKYKINRIEIANNYLKKSSIFSKDNKLVDTRVTRTYSPIDYGSSSSSSFGGSSGTHTSHSGSSHGGGGGHSF